MNYYLRLSGLLVLVSCLASNNNNNRPSSVVFCHHLNLLDPNSAADLLVAAGNGRPDTADEIQLSNGDVSSVEYEHPPTIKDTQQASSASSARLNFDAANYQPTGSCQLVNVVHLLRHAGCQPKAIASFACSGWCSSYVQTSTSKFWQHERSCSCCQQTGSQEATFTLDCPSLDPPYKKVKTHAPVDCLCRSCTDSTKEDLRPHELVEVLASETTNGSNNDKGQQRR